MLKLFGAKPDHPLADAREAKRILDAMPGDPFKALEELSHWIESTSTVEGFKPEQRASTVIMLDDTALPHLRKLQRDYLAMPRLSKFQEHRTWSAVHGFVKQAGLAYARCLEASGAGGAKATELALIAVRGLRSLAAQMKWQYMRYGPFDNSIWGQVGRIYALAETKKFAQTRVQTYSGVPGESSPEQEFLKAIMLAASSPDCLLPAEIDLVEKLVAHLSGSVTLTMEQQPDIAYWIDLAKGEAPLRLARPPQHAPTLRFMAAGKAAKELEQLIQSLSVSKTVPASLGVGAQDHEVVLDALRHLALYWSPKPQARKSPRHQVKSRLTVSHGLDGVLAVLDPAGSLDFDQGRIESWIIENVSVGGFGVTIPHIKGEWLQIDCLLALQPEGGDNWVLGVIRRFSRETPQQGTVGIQTLARSPVTVTARVPDAGGEERVVLLDPSDDSPEVHCLMRNGAVAPGQNLEIERDGKIYLLLPAGVAERGEDYEVLRFRQMIRET